MSESVEPETIVSIETAVSEPGAVEPENDNQLIITESTITEGSNGGMENIDTESRIVSRQVRVVRTMQTDNDGNVQVYSITSQSVTGESMPGESTQTEEVIVKEIPFETSQEDLTSAERNLLAQLVEKFVDPVDISNTLSFGATNDFTVDRAFSAGDKDFSVSEAQNESTENSASIENASTTGSVELEFVLNQPMTVNTSQIKTTGNETRMIKFIPGETLRSIETIEIIPNDVQETNEVQNIVLENQTGDVIKQNLLMGGVPMGNLQGYNVTTEVFTNEITPTLSYTKGYTVKRFVRNETDLADTTDDGKKTETLKNEVFKQESIPIDFMQAESARVSVEDLNIGNVGSVQTSANKTIFTSSDEEKKHFSSENVNNKSDAQINELIATVQLSLQKLGTATFENASNSVSIDNVESIEAENVDDAKTNTVSNSNSEQVSVEIKSNEILSEVPNGPEYTVESAKIKVRGSIQVESSVPLKVAEHLTKEEADIEYNDHSITDSETEHVTKHVDVAVEAVKIQPELLNSNTVPAVDSEHVNGKDEGILKPSLIETSNVTTSQSNDVEEIKLQATTEKTGESIQLSLLSETAESSTKNALEVNLKEIDRSEPVSRDTTTALENGSQDVSKSQITVSESLQKHSNESILEETNTPNYTVEAATVKVVETKQLDSSVPLKLAEHLTKEEADIALNDHTIIDSGAEHITKSVDIPLKNDSESENVTKRAQHVEHSVKIESESENVIKQDQAALESVKLDSESENVNTHDQAAVDTVKIESEFENVNTQDQTVVETVRIESESESVNIQDETVVESVKIESVSESVNTQDQAAVDTVKIESESENDTKQDQAAVKNDYTQDQTVVESIKLESESESVNIKDQTVVESAKIESVSESVYTQDQAAVDTVKLESESESVTKQDLAVVRSAKIESEFENVNAQDQTVVETVKIESESENGTKQDHAAVESVKIESESENFTEPNVDSSHETIKCSDENFFKSETTEVTTVNLSEVPGEVIACGPIYTYASLQLLKTSESPVLEDAVFKQSEPIATAVDVLPTQMGSHDAQIKETVIPPTFTEVEAVDSEKRDVVVVAETSSTDKDITTNPELSNVEPVVISSKAEKTEESVADFIQTSVLSSEVEIGATSNYSQPINTLNSDAEINLINVQSGINTSALIENSTIEAATETNEPKAEPTNLEQRQVVSLVAESIGDESVTNEVIEETHAVVEKTVVLPLQTVLVSTEHTPVDTKPIESSETTTEVHVERQTIVAEPVTLDILSTQSLTNSKLELSSEPIINEVITKTLNTSSLENTQTEPAKVESLVSLETTGSSHMEATRINTELELKPVSIDTVVLKDVVEAKPIIVESQNNFEIEQVSKAFSVGLSNTPQSVSFEIKPQESIETRKIVIESIPFKPSTFNTVSEKSVLLESSLKDKETVKNYNKKLESSTSEGSFEETITTESAYYVYTAPARSIPVKAVPDKKYRVIVTGFGPFQDVSVNISTQTADDLWSLEWPSNIELITMELPVVYEAIDEQVPDLIKTYNPDLIVHLGLDGGATSLEVEQRSFNKNYYILDEVDKHPPFEVCKSDGAPSLRTNLNVFEICEFTNDYCRKKNLKSRCHESEDPGNFICGYIYYLSLYFDNSKALLVHLPEGIYDISDMAQAVQYIIFNSLEQLNKPPASSYR